MGVPKRHLLTPTRPSECAAPPHAAKVPPSGHVWEREQVDAPDEEVAVEGGDPQPARGADAHHRLEPLLPRQRVLQRAREALAYRELELA
jgi:hypothetical protein